MRVMMAHRQKQIRVALRSGATTSREIARTLEISESLARYYLVRMSDVIRTTARRDPLRRASVHYALREDV